MTNAFKKPPGPYGASTPVETPYMRASQVWDDRIGSARAQARNWRIMAFGSLALSFVLLLGYISERASSHVATYVVPVDAQGRPGRIELAGKIYQPSVAETGYFLADWIGWVRARSPLDPIVNSQNLRRAYNFVAGAARGQLDAVGQAAEAADKTAGGAAGVTVEVKSVIQRSPVSYQLQWTETSFREGQQTLVTHWTGLFTTKVIPPHDEAALRANPLGLFITGFQISQELNS